MIVNVLVDAGARLDPAGKEGLGNLTADLLTEGTEKRSAQQISDAADFIGASLSSSAGDDYASVRLTVLRKYLNEGLDLLAGVLLRPDLSAAGGGRAGGRRMLAAIRSSEDNPGAVAERAFDKALFGSGPYGHPVMGWPDAVRSSDARRHPGVSIAAGTRPPSTR